MDTFKSVMLSKLALRLMYITAAYSTSHIVGLLASPKVTAFLAGDGVNLEITDPMKFKTAITAAMLFGGEFVYHFIHEKFIIPNLPSQQSANPNQGVQK